MPFDVATPDLTTPSLGGLSWLLRHQEAWPEGFVWDYTECRACGMGLAIALWDKKTLDRLGDRNTSYAIAAGATMKLFPSSFCRAGDFEDIFRVVQSTLDIFHEDVRPSHVADAIDAYLARSS